MTWITFWPNRLNSLGYHLFHLPTGPRSFPQSSRLHFRWWSLILWPKLWSEYLCLYNQPCQITRWWNLIERCLGGCDIYPNLWLLYLPWVLLRPIILIWVHILCISIINLETLLPRWGFQVSTHLPWVPIIWMHCLCKLGDLIKLLRFPWSWTAHIFLIPRCSKFKWILECAELDFWVGWIYWYCGGSLIFVNLRWDILSWAIQ